MPVWQNVNLKQKAIFEIIQREHTSNLPYYLEGEELDFFVRGLAQGPHAKTYLPQLVERDKHPIYIGRGHAPPQYSRCVCLRYYGPDPVLKLAGPNWPSGCEGELREYTVGWRWLYAYWDGPLVDEVAGGDRKDWWPEIARGISAGRRFRPTCCISCSAARPWLAWGLPRNWVRARILFPLPLSHGWRKTQISVPRWYPRPSAWSEKAPFRTSQRRSSLTSISFRFRPFFLSPSSSEGW